MRQRTTKLRLAMLLAALVAAAALIPLSYRYTHPVARHPAAVAKAVPTPPPGHGTDTPVAAATPPGTEVVPPEESEGNEAAPETPESTPRPTESFGRLAGLHNVPDPLHINASAALVVDHDTGEVLARKNDQAVLPIASLTKLMTTLLVFEARQPMDEVLTITEDDVDSLRHSRSRLRVGTKLTREEALHLALMSSENRAAHALARYYPGGVPKLVEAMNAKAKALGMKNTTYVDPTGLSNENRSTARDLAVLAATAVQNPLMRDFTTTKQHLANLGGRFLQYNNSDRLVKNPNWDIELQKTGYIVEAGRCLVVVTRVAGHELIMVLLDSDSNGTRIADAERLRHTVVAQQGWQDTQVALVRPAAPARHLAARHVPQRGGHHRESLVASKAPEARPQRHAATAHKEVHQAVHREVHRVAHREVHKSETVADSKAPVHRVHQTFSATHHATHS